MKFTTEETAEGNNLFVEKRNGKRQRFIYEKLFTSLVYAFEKGKGSDHGDQALLAKKVVGELIAHLMEKNRKDITTGLLITLCYDTLFRDYPHAAERYMHYSLYREKMCAPIRARIERSNRKK
ncbi:MAG TPA: ATP cone domain-containing protein [Candidatus Paceibacterota bacterium]|nr:ATP cone domain-containing protein [Candidatus Paceibacterota bacterium]